MEYGVLLILLKLEVIL